MDSSGAWPRIQGGLPPPPSVPPALFPLLPAPLAKRGVCSDSLAVDGEAARLASNETFVPRRRYTTSGQSDVFAALDLGTNNCRLMIATRATNGFRVVDSFSRIVRLGEGLQHTGVLGEEAMERTLEALRMCAGRLARRPLAGLRAVATEACRRARNGGVFLERIRRETGIDLQIISAREEAELAVESCAGLLFGQGMARPHSSAGAEPQRGLLVDIGGGSTEIAWVRLDHKRRKHDVIGYISLPVGVITLAEQFYHRHPDVYRTMVTHVREHLETFETTHRIRREIVSGQVRVVGTSGTVTTLASLDLDLPRYTRWAVDGYALSVNAARGAIGRLHRMGREGMNVHPCIGQERAAYVMPGCAIFDAFLSLWPSEVVVADRGLRDGLLLRMMQEGAAGMGKWEGRVRQRPALG